MIKDFRTDTWEDVKECAKNKKMFIFGAGQFGQTVYREMNKYQTSWDIIGFLDNDPNKKIETICGLPVYTPDVVKNYSMQDIIVLICSMKVANMARQLDELGVVHYFSYFFLDLPNGLRETCYQTDISIEDIEWLGQRLEDNESKNLLKEIVNKRKIGSFDYTDIQSQCSEYFFNEFFEISDDEVFVDGGGFDGDTIEEFINFTQGKYKRIYSFEPQKDKIEIIKQKLWKYNGKVVLFEKGLYDCQTELCFAAGDDNLSGRIEENQDGEIIQTIDIDSAIQEPVTYIKMDIEGAELKALQGAAETIKRDKPKLAICIYHKPEDLWEIPRYIDSLVPEYKFYIKHFGWRYTSTVLYCTL